MDIKQELKYVINKHKDDRLQTFQTDIVAMAKSCLREIESLEDIISKMARKIKQFEERYFED